MAWYRVHEGMSNDIKWPLIAQKAACRPGDVVAVWVALLDHASQASPRGSIDGFDPEYLDAFYGYEPGATAAIMDALIGKGIIKDGALANWNKRQPQKEDDSASERKKRWNKKSGASQTGNYQNQPPCEMEYEASQENEMEMEYEATQENEMERLGTPKNALERFGTQENAKERLGTPKNALERFGTPGNAPDTDTDTDTEVIKEKDIISSAPKTATEQEEVFISMPVVGDPNCHECDIGVSQLERWRELYPAIDVAQELRAALAWLEANPSRRKTRTGLMRFLNNWLARAQNQSRGQGRSPQSDKAALANMVLSHRNAQRSNAHEMRPKDAIALAGNS